MDILASVGIPTLLVSIFAVIGLILALPSLSRAVVRSTGQPAEAVILARRTGAGQVYGANQALVAQELVLSLEIHPAAGAAYQAEVRAMVSLTDAARLEPGCIVQVRIARNDPRQVAVLPETSRPGPNVPTPNKT